MKKTALKSKNVFIDDYRAGKASLDDIEKYLDQWHEGNGYGVPIHEFLGLTKEEYFSWAENQDKFKSEFNTSHAEEKTEHVAGKIVSGIESN